MTDSARGGERCFCGDLVAYGELHWTDDARHKALVLAERFEAEATAAQDAMERVVLNGCARRVRETLVGR